MTGRAETVAIRTLQAGAIAVVVAASTLKVFELDRYFVPKEIALHVTALVAMIALVPSLRRMTWSRTDLMLVAFLALGVISSVFATNHWVAMRSLAISVSSVAVFLAARAMRASGHSPSANPVLGSRARTVVVSALVLLCLLGTVRSILQAVGMSLYSPRRTASLVWTSRLDPGSYRAHMLLARTGRGLSRGERCAHARAAANLFPHATASRNAVRGCATAR